MLDLRIKQPQSGGSWRYKEIIVTQEYLNKHKDNPNLIQLDSRYQIGANALDIYFNGQRLIAGITSEDGIGFEEVDDMHVCLHLGYDDSSSPQPLFIEAGDVIVIKEWYNVQSPFYSYPILNTRMTKTELEIAASKGEYESLEKRLEGIEEDIFSLSEEGNYTIEYTYNTNTGNVEKEIITGDYSMTKEYEYDADGKLLKKIIHKGMTKKVHTFIYDEQKRCIKEIIVTGLVL